MRLTAIFSSQPKLQRTFGVIACAALIGLGAACTPEKITRDAGAGDKDAGVGDSGVGDTGRPPADTGTPVDTGTPPADTGVIDTGEDAGVDTGVVDTGVMDAEVDAGPPDTGMVDTGVMDTGTPDSGFPPLNNWCQGQPANFSFFVTSMNALWALSGDNINDWNGGFGGDFGGIAGADHICQTIANATGNGARTWQAFLSATDDGNGSPVHAIDRVGQGPWIDANGRQVASGVAGLLSGLRPDGDAQSTADLPDECGVPLSALGDAHDVVTGSNNQGRVNSNNMSDTCNDWTSVSGNLDQPMCGHSFPRTPGQNRGANWRSDHTLRGCTRGANLLQNGPGVGTCIGCSGGYGALYCFAL